MCRRCLGLYEPDNDYCRELNTDLTRYGMIDKKRTTKLAQKSQSEDPAETLIPSGVDTFDPVFVSWGYF